MMHQRPEKWIGTSYWRRLVGVDQSCGELAGLVDSKGAVEELTLGL